MWRVKSNENKNVTPVKNYDKFEVPKASLMKTLMVIIPRQERQFTESKTGLAD
jgi:hypothetical protein